MALCTHSGSGLQDTLPSQEGHNVSGLSLWPYHHEVPSQQCSPPWQPHPPGVGVCWSRAVGVPQPHAGFVRGRAQRGFLLLLPTMQRCSRARGTASRGTWGVAGAALAPGHVVCKMGCLCV